MTVQSPSSGETQLELRPTSQALSLSVRGASTLPRFMYFVRPLVPSPLTAGKYFSAVLHVEETDRRTGLPSALLPGLAWAPGREASGALDSGREVRRWLAAQRGQRPRQGPTAELRPQLSLPVSHLGFSHRTTGHPETEQTGVGEPANQLEEKRTKENQVPEPSLPPAGVLCFPVLEPGLGFRSPTCHTQGSRNGRQTLGLQGGVLARHGHVRRPHPSPEGPQPQSHTGGGGEQTGRGRVAPGPGLATTGGPADTCGQSLFPAAPAAASLIPSLGPGRAGLGWGWRARGSS